MTMQQKREAVVIFYKMFYLRKINDIELRLRLRWVMNQPESK